MSEDGPARGDEAMREAVIPVEEIKTKRAEYSRPIMLPWYRYIST